MQLLNETPFAARLLRVARGGEGEVQAIVVVKATFACSSDERWVPSAEQIPIIDDRLDTPFGVFHTDCFARKDGADICVLGTIRLERPTRTQHLSIEVGPLRNALVVAGDRHWVQRGIDLVASDPTPFVEMPLSYGRAYGGATEHDYETVTWPDNPIGRGYYLSAGEAAGMPLPNIEPALGPFVREWNDQPPVAGWAPYPLFWGIRAREGVEPRASPEERFFPRIKARLNNHAHPLLVLPQCEEGVPIRISGMRKHEIAFEPPRVRPMVEVEVGSASFEAAGRLDGIFVWADLGRLTVTYRIPFRYQYVKGVERRARLVNALPQVGGHTWRA